MEPFDTETLLALGTVLVSVGMAYATTQAILKRNAKDIEEAKVEQQKRDHEHRLHEQRTASLEKDHGDLARRHNEAAAEMRTRASALEGRATTLERDGVEVRAELRALTATTARIEAKQDAAATNQEQLRTDVLRALAAIPTPRKR